MSSLTDLFPFCIGNSFRPLMGFSVTRPTCSRCPSEFMFGAGGHMVWIDPDNDAVVVARWLDGAHSAGFVRRVAQALRS